MTDALIHLRVPRALKARWVKASQARGMKLTDWIVAQMERAQAMKTYPIPESLASAYHGACYAMAAIAGGQPVVLRYLEDHVDEATQDALAEGGHVARAAARRWIASDAAGPVVRDLQALGQVSLGMCSGWEFVEL